MEGQVEEARVEEIRTVEGFDSKEAVLGAGKCLTAFVVPFIRLTFVFPIVGFSTSRRFGEGAETIRPNGLTPAREFPFGSSLIFGMPVGMDRFTALVCILALSKGREMGKTISGTDLTDTGIRANVGS